MKTKAKKYKKPLLVTISALALSAAPGNLARAQVQISCPSNLRFGRLAACATGNLKLAATGATNTAGCAVITQQAKVAKCVISTGGVVPTKNVIVDVSANIVNITNGGNTAKVDNFTLIHAGITSSQPKATFTPIEVQNTVTVDIGATLRFSNGQPLGSYTGSVVVTAN